MRSAFGKVPNDPRIYGAKSQFTTLGTLPRPGHFAEDPADFTAAEIGISDESRFGGDGGAVLGFEALAKVRGAAVLPHDGVVNGLAR